MPKLLNMNPPTPEVIQSAVIAFGPQGATAVWATKMLRDDMAVGGYNVVDCFPDDKNMPTGPGIWIWEGQIVGITYPSSPNGPEECDVEYRGTWRKPHDYEWTLIQQGKTPLEHICPLG